MPVEASTEDILAGCLLLFCLRTSGLPSPLFFPFSYHVFIGFISGGEKICNYSFCATSEVGFYLWAEGSVIHRGHQTSFLDRWNVLLSLSHMSFLFLWLSVLDAKSDFIFLTGFKVHGWISSPSRRESWETGWLHFFCPMAILGWLTMILILEVA